MPDRQAAYNVTVFALGGTDLLGQLENATFKTDVKHEEAKGVADLYRYPWATDAGWDIEADLYAGAHSLVMQYVGESVTVSYTTGGTNYSGTALVTTGSDMGSNAGIKKQKLTLIGQGAPTIV